MTAFLLKHATLCMRRCVSWAPDRTFAVQSSPRALRILRLTRQDRRTCQTSCRARRNLHRNLRRRSWWIWCAFCCCPTIAQNWHCPMGPTVQSSVNKLCTPYLGPTRSACLHAPVFACHRLSAHPCRAAPRPHLKAMGSMWTKPVLSEPGGRADTVKAASVDVGSTSNTFVVSIRALHDAPRFLRYAVLHSQPVIRRLIQVPLGRTPV